MSALERREQLLEVARELFATKGFEALTVEEIALAAGVSKPIIYEHFGTSDSTTGAGAKESMYAVIVDREIANLLQTIEKSLDDHIQEFWLNKRRWDFSPTLKRTQKDFRFWYGTLRLE